MKKLLIFLILLLSISSVFSKSRKRGIAYDLGSWGDIGAISSGTSWWYNWSPRRNQGVPADYRTRFDIEFIPMLWNDNFNEDEIVNTIQATGVKFFLVLNEPNLVNQANMTPQKAANIWPKFERVAQRSGAALVGPQITWGTMLGYNDPVVWMDNFISSYKDQNGGRAPRFDYLGFHWYDYGLAEQLDRLTKYGKQFWVTEMANWHGGNDGAEIDTLQKQQAQCKDMVNTCESRSDVYRYAWFTGRWNPDPHYTSLLLGDGVLSALGNTYTQA